MRQRNSRWLNFFYAVMGCAWAFAGMIGFQRLSLTYTYTTQDWGLPALIAVALGMGWFAGVLALRGQSRGARLSRSVLFVGLWLLFLTMVAVGYGLDAAPTSLAPGLDIALTLFPFIFAAYLLAVSAAKETNSL
jgi:hypothetical protein